MQKLCWLHREQTTKVKFSRKSIHGFLKHVQHITDVKLSPFIANGKRWQTKEMVLGETKIK